MKKITRKEFIRLLETSAIAVGSILITGCANSSKSPSSGTHFLEILSILMEFKSSFHFGIKKMCLTLPRIPIIKIKKSFRCIYL